MLRVYSILYLEQVWARPSSFVLQQQTKKSVVTVAEVDLSSLSAQIEDEGVTTDYYGTVSSPSNQSHRELAETRRSAVDQEDDDDDDDVGTITTTIPSATMGELSCSNSINNTSSLSPPSSLSETPLTQHDPPVIDFTNETNPVTTTNNSKKIVLVHHECEYYDDDIDIEEEEEVNDFTPPPTPPIPTSTNKFSPKSMLHRAKSSINDESVVRNLGRRTSLFLEKLNHNQISSLPVLIPPLRNKNATTGKEDFSKGLRRQSSKLSVKGKTLTKKLKRVLSFHQPQQKQA